MSNNTTIDTVSDDTNATERKSRKPAPPKLTNITYDYLMEHGSVNKAGRFSIDVEMLNAIKAGKRGGAGRVGIDWNAVWPVLMEAAQPIGDSGMLLVPLAAVMGAGLPETAVTSPSYWSGKALNSTLHAAEQGYRVRGQFSLTDLGNAGLQLRPFASDEAQDEYVGACHAARTKAEAAAEE